MAVLLLLGSILGPLSVEHYHVRCFSRGHSSLKSHHKSPYFSQYSDGLLAQMFCIHYTSALSKSQAFTSTFEVRISKLEFLTTFGYHIGMKDRGYNQYCGLAYALDIVGKRWTLLIVRELIAGPRRFKDLVDGLPDVSTNLLSDRL